MKAFSALLRREYWEHKGSMFYTPAIIAGLLALMMIVGMLTSGTLTVDDHEFSFTKSAPYLLEHLESMDVDKREMMVQGGLQSPASIFGFVLLLISLFYALGCLYDERKDRSILFWKSLPVSDSSTVLSKFLSITIVTPVFYFAAITVFQLFLMIFLTIGAWFGGSSGVVLWTSSNLPVVILDTLFSLIIASLWLSPLWAWCMLASSWAKKVAFLWGTLPIVMIIVAEVWIFNSTQFGVLVRDRIIDGFAIQNSFISRLSSEQIFDSSITNAYQSVLSLEFVVGLMIAAVFLAGAIYTRRFRDES